MCIRDSPHILNIHDLVYHDYGPGRAMMSFHVEVPAGCDLLEIHDVVAVSYTHLDVYKRQGSDRGVRGGGSPPRMRSHPPQPLYVKGCGEQSEDFSAPERAEK